MVDSENKKSTGLQRRYRGDSVVEQSVPKEHKRDEKARKNVHLDNVNNVDITLPSINSNNNNRIKNKPIVNYKPSVHYKKELPDIEERILNTRQRRYRPYNPVVQDVPTKPKAFNTNNNTPSSNSESVEYYNNYSNNQLNYTSKYNNTTQTFNIPQLYPTINSNRFCQCDNDNNSNTCKQCSSLTSLPTCAHNQCCCACPCYQQKYINHCNYYPLHTSHTTPPKRLREQSFLHREYPKSNYFEPLLQANSFFNHHYAPTNSVRTKHIALPPNNEKHRSIISLPTTSYKAFPYTNAFRLHYGSITYIISLTPFTSPICYATSSIDSTIKLWDESINLVSTIETHNTYSKCLLHFQTEYLLSAEGSSIFAYAIRPPNQVQYIFRDHIGEVNFLLSLGDKFVSAGDDKTLRLWSISPERVSKRYEGHKGAVRKIAKVFNETYLASFGDDKRILLWEVTQSLPIACVDTNYAIADVHGTALGFVSGSYDNKIRFYSLKGGIAEVFAVFEMDYYYCRSFISGNEHDSVLLFNTFVNEIVALDTATRTIVRLFKGPAYDKRMNMIIKDFSWENRNTDANNNDKQFIGICQDGCLYIWNYTVNALNADNNGHDNESKLKSPTSVNELNASNESSEGCRGEKELNDMNTNDNVAHKEH